MNTEQRVLKNIFSHEYFLSNILNFAIKKIKNESLIPANTVGNKTIHCNYFSTVKGHQHKCLVNFTNMIISELNSLPSELFTHLPVLKVNKD